MKVNIEMEFQSMMIWAHKQNDVHWNGWCSISFLSLVHLQFTSGDIYFDVLSWKGYPPIYLFF